jgi:hypothetical protein
VRRPRVPHPDNVPGPVYVEDGCCLGCNVWQDVAGEFLAWQGNDDHGHCHVSRQPKDCNEFEAIVAAMKLQEVDCIRLRGGPASWRNRLIAAGQEMFIDDEDGD